MTVNKDFFNKPKTKTAHASQAFVEADIQPHEPVYVPIYKKRETRSKRLNLLITPSLHAAMLAKAERLGISFNEACNHAFSNYVKRVK